MWASGLPVARKFAIIAGFPPELTESHETHLSTLKDTPRKNTRLFGSHENPWWSCSDQCSPRKGPQTPGSLINGLALTGLVAEQFNDSAVACSV